MHSGLNGTSYTLTGTVTEGTSPLDVTTYAVDSLTLTDSMLLGSNLVACNTPGVPAQCASDTTLPTLMITEDSASLIFDVVVFGLKGSVSATINAPAGTSEDMEQVSLQDFSNVVIQSGSTLTYGAGVISGEVAGSGFARKDRQLALIGGASGPPQLQ